MCGLTTQCAQRMGLGFFDLKLVGVHIDSGVWNASGF